MDTTHCPSTTSRTAHCREHGLLLRLHAKQTTRMPDSLLPRRAKCGDRTPALEKRRILARSSVVLPRSADRHRPLLAPATLPVLAALRPVRILAPRPPTLTRSPKIGRSDVAPLRCLPPRFNEAAACPLPSASCYSLRGHRRAQKAHHLPLLSRRARDELRAGDSVTGEGVIARREARIALGTPSSWTPLSSARRAPAAPHRRLSRTDRTAAARSGMRREARARDEV